MTTVNDYINSGWPDILEKWGGIIKEYATIFFWIGQGEDPRLDKADSAGVCLALTLDYVKSRIKGGEVFQSFINTNRWRSRNLIYFIQEKDYERKFALLPDDIYKKQRDLEINYRANAKAILEATNDLYSKEFECKDHPKESPESARCYEGLKKELKLIQDRESLMYEGLLVKDTDLLNLADSMKQIGKEIEKRIGPYSVFFMMRLYSDNEEGGHILTCRVKQNEKSELFDANLGLIQFNSANSTSDLVKFLEFELVPFYVHLGYNLIGFDRAEKRR